MSFLDERPLINRANELLALFRADHYSTSDLTKSPNKKDARSTRFDDLNTHVIIDGQEWVTYKWAWQFIGTSESYFYLLMRVHKPKTRFYPGYTKLNLVLLSDINILQANHKKRRKVS